MCIWKGLKGHRSTYAVLLSPSLSSSVQDAANPHAFHCLQKGTFLVKLHLPTEYPFKPPTVSFATRIYHPNVTNDEKGSMCLGMLKSDEWKPSSRISAVLQFARQLLEEPMPDDAVEARIAEQYNNDRKRYEEIARDWTRRYATKAWSRVEASHGLLEQARRLYWGSFVIIHSSFITTAGVLFLGQFYGFIWGSQSSTEYSLQIYRVHEYEKTVKQCIYVVLHISHVVVRLHATSTICFCTGFLSSRWFAFLQGIIIG